MTHRLNVLYLRNEFYFWKVHGIMNTLGLLQKVSEARSIHDSMKLPIIEFIGICLYLHFIIKI